MTRHMGSSRWEGGVLQLPLCQRHGARPLCPVVPVTPEFVCFYLVNFDGPAIRAFLLNPSMPFGACTWVPPPSGGMPREGVVDSPSVQHPPPPPSPDRHWTSTSKLAWAKERLSELLSNLPAELDPEQGSLGITTVKSITGEVGAARGEYMGHGPGACRHRYLPERIGRGQGGASRGEQAWACRA